MRVSGRSSVEINNTIATVELLLLHLGVICKLHETVRSAWFLLGINNGVMHNLKR